MTAENGNVNEAWKPMPGVGWFYIVLGLASLAVAIVAFLAGFVLVVAIASVLSIGFIFVAEHIRDQSEWWFDITAGVFGMFRRIQ